MKLIVGLGNPGEQYSKTRHNIGFSVIDQILSDNQLMMDKQKFNADYTIWRLAEDKVFLVKPYTYMNNSGEAVLPLMSYFNVSADDLCVVYDDMDLALGRLRLRTKGSAGGHNGMKNMINLLGTSEFKRIRIGIGHPEGPYKVVDHVLSAFTPSEQLLVDQSVDKAAQAIDDWVKGASFEEVMKEYNQK